MIIFQNKEHSSIRLMGSKIIVLVKHWCKIKWEGYMDTIHLILPTNVDLLPVQITGVSYRLMPPEEGDWFGRGLELISS
jgi:hypothetical protein